MTATIETPDLAPMYDVPDDDEGRKTWKVDCLGKATWALERSAELARRQAEIRDVALANIERWMAWEREEVAKLDRDRNFFEGSVTAYALERRAEDPKRNRSLVTPFGAVRTTSGRGKWLTDEAVVLAWAKEHRPEFVKTSEVFALGDAKKVFIVSEDGEVVDPVLGVRVDGITPGPERISTTVTLDLGGVL